MTYRELLLLGEDKLNRAEIDDFKFDAFQLLLFAAQYNYSEFLLISDKNVDSEFEKIYLGLIDRRCAREPLQYIIGKWSFFESEFYVGPGVLIPRPETEELVDICISFVKENNCKIVLDLCTGSGCIGLSIAKKCPSVMCYLLDYYDEALFYAEKNAAAFKLDNVKIIKHDITKVPDILLPDADLIVSNPPYIRTDDIACLQCEVQQEPLTALDGGADGYVFYNAIRHIWLDKLKTGGMIAIECGEGQSERICEIFGDMCNCDCVNDIYGADRFVRGIKFTGG